MEVGTPGVCGFGASPAFGLPGIEPEAPPTPDAGGLLKPNKTLPGRRWRNQFWTNSEPFFSYIPSRLWCTLVPDRQLAGCEPEALAVLGAVDVCSTHHSRQRMRRRLYELREEMQKFNWQDHRQSFTFS